MKTNPNKASIITRDLDKLSDKSGNLYKSVAIAGKRAKQVSTKTKEELSAKLSEFATTVDNLEEVFENREQIEISKYYERMPKPSMVGLEELLADELHFVDNSPKY